jgi:lysophospholipid acyltransferase (LPLAT)-like uncharacterized protein
LPKRITTAPWAQKAIGILAAEYLRLVWKTSRFVFEPADLYDRIVPDMPFVLTMWHGQHFLIPCLRRKGQRFKVMISRHRDGEINAIVSEWLGVKAIRGSGAHDREFQRKGAVAAFMGMLTALEEGYNAALTADVPKVSRVAGMGVVMLARTSGRPIYPIAVATSRRYELDNWDHTAFNLPFSRGAVVMGDPIHVPADAGDAALEDARRAVEAGLNAATDRAYAIVDRRQGGTPRA